MMEKLLKPIELKEFNKIHRNLDFVYANKNLGPRQSLWHAIKVTHAAEQLSLGVLSPHTSHRYWEDGIRRKEKDPLYENSYWMYGWSMTRKREYAQKWGSVVFELDQTKIAEHFDIVPISWNNLFEQHKKFQKKEFEEFVIAKKVSKSIDDYKKEELDREKVLDMLYDLKDKNVSTDILLKIEQLEKQSSSWIKEWQKPKGHDIDLNKCLKAIYINEDDFKEALKDKNGHWYNNMCQIVQHPRFCGTFENPHTLKYAKAKI